MLTKAALAFGVVLTIIGLGGFIPALAPENSAGVPLLLGIFAVSALHNIIHLASGVAALIASKSNEYARLYFQVFGVVYAIVTVVGFIQGDKVLVDQIPVNLADNLLHIAIAGVSLTLGFGPYGKATTKTV